MSKELGGDIVVGVGADGSGDYAATSAARIASQLGSKLVIACGYEPSALGGARGGLREEIEAIAEETVGAVRADIEAEFPGLQVAVEYVADRAVETVIRVGDAYDALVLVVGHGGGGPLTGALLGSVTYELVHRAPRPVLVVPEPTD